MVRKGPDSDGWHHGPFRITEGPEPSFNVDEEVIQRKLERQ